MGRLMVLCGFSLVLALLLLVVGFIGDPANFPIGTVEVEGQLNHVERSVLMRRLEPLVKPGFLRIDVDTVVASTKSLPWIDSVEVQRLWPDRLVLRITEQLPVARWNGSALINARGAVFHQDPDRAVAGLPEIWGPEAQREYIFRRFVEFQRLLQTPMGNLKKLELAHQGSWIIDLESGGVLIIRNAEPMQDLANFLTLWPEIAAKSDQQFQSIDLRYEHGFAVLWKSPLTSGAS